MRSVLIALMMLLPTCAQAAEVLVYDGPGFTVHLTDEPCSPAVQKLIRPDWAFELHGGSVDFMDSGLHSSLRLCYSITPDGVTILDEHGEGPAGPTPLEKFRKSDNPDYTPNDGHHI